MKLYYTTYMTGMRSRYWVYFHDGKQFHNDGSEFYDVQTFSNKPATTAFIKGLMRKGYTERREWPKTTLTTKPEAS